MNIHSPKLISLSLVLLAHFSLCASVTVLLDFGTDSTYRGVSVTGADSNGNVWNSIGFGYTANLLDTAGSPTTFDFAPDGLGGTDSYNSYGATSNPVTATELATVQSKLDTGSPGLFGVAEAAIDFFQSSNATTSVGRFQIQQVTPGQIYDLSFFGSKMYMGNQQTTFTVFDDSGYTNELGSVTITHGSGGTPNTSEVGLISGIVGPNNSNNILYVQWEGVTTSTEGFLSSMAITAVPEPASIVIWAGTAAFVGLIYRRRRLGHR